MERRRDEEHVDIIRSKAEVETLAEISTSGSDGSLKWGAIVVVVRCLSRALDIRVVIERAFWLNSNLGQSRGKGARQMQVRRSPMIVHVVDVSST